MSVETFDHRTVREPALRGDGAGFFAGGQFTIRIRFTASDCLNFQYRQYIRGTATLQQGRFEGERLPGNWVPTAEPESVGRLFAVPGGLQPNLTEDGERRLGHDYHFGYRTGDGVEEEGLEDRYIPHPNGPEYRLRDTFGLRGDSRPVATRIRINLFFKGEVIDDRRPERPVLTREWSYRLDDLFP